VWNHRRRGGKYGDKLYFYSCNGKWLKDFQVSCKYLVSFGIYDKMLRRAYHIKII
jgi:hypothetical protein